MQDSPWNEIVEMDAYLFANFFNSNRTPIPPSPPKPSFSFRITPQTHTLWAAIGTANLPEGSRIQMFIEGEDCSTSGFLCEAGYYKTFIIRFEKKFNSCKKVSGQNIDSVIRHTEKSGFLRFVSSEGVFGPLATITVRFNGIDKQPSEEWLCENTTYGQINP